MFWLFKHIYKLCQTEENSILWDYTDTYTLSIDARKYIFKMIRCKIKAIKENVMVNIWKRTYVGNVRTKRAVTKTDKGNILDIVRQ